MELILSRQNPLIKERSKLHQKKYRERTGLFLIEGIRLVEEAIKAERVEELYIEESLFNSAQGRKLFELITQKSLRCFRVNKEIIKLLTDTASPQGIVGVVRQQNLSLTELKTNSGLIIILDGLQDPGNFGSIWRIAWAAGVDGILCLPGTVDPYNNKIVRATMGGIFHVPVITGVGWLEVQRWCQKQGFTLVAGDIQAERSHFAVNYPEKVALLIGNEAQGFLSVDLAEVKMRVKIPLLNEAESLNAAVACGILVYEIIRQRTGLSVL